MEEIVLDMAPLAFSRGFIPIVVSTMSLGPQNSFVLSHGLTRNNLLLAIGTCLACDCVLIAAGVSLNTEMLQSSGEVIFALKGAGSAYLVLFGVSYLKSALCGRPASASTSLMQCGRVIVSGLGVSLLNPLAYMETMFVPAGLGSGLSAQLLPFLAVGAMTGAVVKFCLLGLAALRMAELFARPSARRMFDLACGLIMSATGSVIALTMMPGV